MANFPIGPTIHVVATFVISDIVGTILYKKTRKTNWSFLALQVAPAICFVSGIIFVMIWIPCQ